MGHTRRGRPPAMRRYRRDTRRARSHSIRKAVVVFLGGAEGRRATSAGGSRGEQFCRRSPPFLHRNQSKSSRLISKFGRSEKRLLRISNALSRAFDDRQESRRFRSDKRASLCCRGDRAATMDSAMDVDEPYHTGSDSGTWAPRLLHFSFSFREKRVN